MGSNEPHEFEAPGARADREEDDDVEGHAKAKMGGDPVSGSRMPLEAAADEGDDEDAEGHGRFKRHIAGA